MAVGKRTQTILAATLFLFWIGVTAYAFWWFEFKNLRPFDTTSAGTVIKPDMEGIYHMLTAALPKDEERISVVHFWNPDCYCNRFNLVHLSLFSNTQKISEDPPTRAGLVLSFD